MTCDDEESGKDVSTEPRSEREQRIYIRSVQFRAITLNRGKGLETSL